uniref:Uncharacterized protein n=1 Tax=Arundo donax TaxID=35708 RepID=A0A0A9AJR6_ARUDO
MQLMRRLWAMATTRALDKVVCCTKT